MSQPEPTGLCENCGLRDATGWWVGDGGVLAFVHGHKKAWCEQCVVRAQIQHAEEMAANLPSLRETLDTLERRES
ncbi:hypothetical protein LCGC14_0312830 [marine sediment metagenome]|uniref:Uncharacterized protein n=1 Tax=marine sediment metagenome TaxID=412755 RepID=A0A0F9W8L9_9ZZZZ